MKIVVVSPYHGGSHRSWAEGLRHFSNHEVDILGLPDRFWKWRMHGGAVTLGKQYKELVGEQADLILATDMLDLTTFLAHTRRETQDCPAILYMHENQLTYPLPADPSLGPMRRQNGERDLHYAFINYSSMVAADRVLFNSNFHRESLLEALGRFLKHFPDNRELQTIAEIEAKSFVLPVGIDLRRFDAWQQARESASPPLILWNHRWEYDKNPEDFFDALYEIYDTGVPFNLAVCGQNFRRQPREFIEAKAVLAKNIVHWGMADEESYGRLLWQADLVVSTAIHEFFGVSVVEAMYCKTMPILPAKLSYPELLPKEIHGECLFKGTRALKQLIRRMLHQGEVRRDTAKVASDHVRRFDWSKIIGDYDDHFQQAFDDNIAK